MKKIITLPILFLFALLLLASSVNANIRNVPGSYSTIQAAINASLNGDTVLAAPGTYIENINFRGKKIVVTGTYYQTNNPSAIYATVINGSMPSNPDSGSCVIINNHEDSTCVLQGFAITGGSGTKWTDEHGAGIYREGGGILIAFSSPVIQNNIIFNNQCVNPAGVSSRGGGGMRIGDSYPRLYNNIIMNNTALYGAGIVLNYTGCIMKNNVVCINYGSNDFGAGSGIWVNSDFTRTKVIENNTIVNNSALAGTGGISAGGTIILRNNIIWGNTSPNNSQIADGNPIAVYCDIQGGYAGTGNINSNPLFSDSSYILTPGSPCVDRGDSSTIYNDPPDPNNNTIALYPSRGVLRNDIGAYGGPLRRVLSNTIIGIHHVGREVPSKFALMQNYPNPFNPTTKIRFDISSGGATGRVALTIFNILGKEVAVIVKEFLKPGNYEFEWNASNYPSGIYFYKLVTGNFTETKKMILVK